MKISINKKSEEILNNLILNADYLNIKIKKGWSNCTIIDAGIDVPGSIEAGLMISEICLGGLGKVNLKFNDYFDLSSMQIDVHSAHPVLACLGSQYAGWSLSSKEFFALGSGPVRSIAQKEEIFKELNYIDEHTKTSIVLEVEKEPPEEIVNKISSDCNMEPENLFFILTPTTSICGNLQVVARVLEVAIHKAHELKFPLDRIKNGFGSAPLPPIAKDFVSGMGRTNDAIIYGGIVQLIVDGPEDDIISLSKELPSISSKDYGKPFKTIFEENDKDFYKIDGFLFSPAQIILNSISSGKTYKTGEVNKKIVNNSFRI